MKTSLSTCQAHSVRFGILTMLLAFACGLLLAAPIFVKQVAASQVQAGSCLMLSADGSVLLYRAAAGQVVVARTSTTAYRQVRRCIVSDGSVNGVEFPWLASDATSTGGNVLFDGDYSSTHPILQTGFIGDGTTIIPELPPVLVTNGNDTNVRASCSNNLFGVNTIAYVDATTQTAALANGPGTVLGSYTTTAGTPLISAYGGCVVWEADSVLNIFSGLANGPLFFDTTRADVNGAYAALSLSADGVILAYENNTGGITVFNTATQTVLQTIANSVAPSVSGNGRFVAYSQVGDIQLLNVSTGQVCDLHYAGSRPSLSYTGGEIALVDASGNIQLALLPQLSVAQTLTLTGSTVSYTITYANGDDAASNVTITDALPTGISYTAGSADTKGTYTAATNTLCWSLGTVPAGGAGQVTFSATITAGATAGTIISNVADIQCSELPAPVMSNPATITVTAPTLQLTKSVSAAVAQQGTALTYTLNYTSSNTTPRNSPATSTGASLSLKIVGQGYFIVQMPDGTQAYTRNGAFSFNAQGQLVTADGFLLQPCITIPYGALSVTVDPYFGAVHVRMPGNASPMTVGSIQLARFTNPDGLQDNGNDIYLQTYDSGCAQTGQPGTNGLGLIYQNTDPPAINDPSPRLVIASTSSNTLNLQIIGQGYFIVQMPNGTQAYTQDGNFSTNAQGQLVTAQGYAVQPNITIPTGAVNVTINPYGGAVSVILNGNACPQIVGCITLARFVNPDALVDDGNGYYSESAQSGAPEQGQAGMNGFGRIYQNTTTNATPAPRQPQDIAPRVSIDGTGFFVVQLPDGTLAYTRNGSFTLNAQGQVVSADGYLLQPNLTIPTAAVNLTVAPYGGAVSIMLNGTSYPQIIGCITLARFMNPAGLLDDGNGYYAESADSGAPEQGQAGMNGFGRIYQNTNGTTNATPPRQPQDVAPRVAINGPGFFMLQLPDGTLAYTRNGAFTLNAQGQVVSADGYLVQPNITIPSNATSVTVDAVGMVSAQISGNSWPTQLGTFQLAAFTSNCLVSIAPGLYAVQANGVGPMMGQPGSNGLGSLFDSTVTAGNPAPPATPLTLAIQGQGYFIIQLPDGSQAYTRNGNFSVNAQGQVVNGQGYPLQPAITLPWRLSESVAADGTVSVIVPYSPTPQIVGSIQLAMFASPEYLILGDHDLFYVSPSSGQPIVGQPGTMGLGVIGANVPTMTNVTYSLATNVTLTDALPTGITFIPGSAGTNSAFTPATRTLCWPLANLATGDSGQVTFQATVNADAPAGPISNIAAITCAQVSAPLQSNPATVTLAPTLSLTKSVSSATASPGDTVTYTLTYAPYVQNFFNTGGTLALTIDGQGYFMLQMPDGEMAYTLGGAFSCNANGQLVSRDGYVLQPNITLPPSTVNVTVGTDGTVSVLLPDNSTQIVGSIQLAAFMNPDGLTYAGNGIYYASQASGSAMVGRPGDMIFGTIGQTTTPASSAIVPSVVSNVTLSDTLPDGITYLPGSASNQGVYDQGTLTWNLGNLSSGASSQQVTFQAVVTGDVGTQINNTATIACTEVSAPVNSNTATFTTVNADPTISGIANQVIYINTNTAALAFSVASTITPADQLTITANCDNDALVTADNLIITGPDADGNCTLVVTPNADQTGIANITLTVTDADGQTSTSVFSVNVISTLQAYPANLLTSLGVVKIGQLPAAQAATGDTLSYRIITNGSRGQVVITNAANGAFTYTPLTQATTGTDNISYQVTSASGRSATSTLTVTLNATLTGVTLTLSPVSPQMEGTRIVLTPKVHGGGQLQYRYRLISNGLSTTLSDYSAMSSFGCDSTGIAPGAYTFAVDVQEASAASTPTVSGLCAMKLVGLTTASTVGLSVEVSSPQIAPANVQLDATVSGGDANHQGVLFRFSVYNNATHMTSLIRPYAADATAIWVATPGSYNLTVFAFDPISNITTPSASIPNYIVYSPALTSANGVSLVISISSPCPTAVVTRKSALTVTAIVPPSIGTGAGLLYQFTVQQTDVTPARTTAFQAYSTANTLNWTPAPGTYALTVLVKDPVSGLIASGAPLTNFVVFVPALTPTSAVSLKASKASPVTVAGNVTLNAAVTIGTGVGVIYTFSIYNTLTGISSTLQSTTSATTCWAATPGTYTLSVTAYDPYTHLTTSAATISHYLVYSPALTGTSGIVLTTGTASPQPASAVTREASIIVQATVPSSLGTGQGLLYQFTAVETDVTPNKTTYCQGYQPTSTITWTPVAGTYTVTVSVKDPASGLYASSNTLTNYVIYTPAMTANSTVSLMTGRPTPQTVSSSQPITLAAVLNIGSGVGVTYTFHVTNALGKVISLNQATPTSTSAIWTATPGIYTMSVSASWLDPASGLISKTSASITYVVYSPALTSANGVTWGLNVSSLPAPGTAVTITPKVTAGTGAGVLYSYQAALGQTITTPLTTPRNSATLSWTPTIAGTYTLTFNALDPVSGFTATKVVTFLVK